MGTQMVQDDTSHFTLGTNYRQPGSIMGGRNEQASIRRSRHDPRIGNVITKRSINKAISKVPEPEANIKAMNESDTNVDPVALAKNLYLCIISIVLLTYTLIMKLMSHWKTFPSSQQQLQ